MIYPKDVFLKAQIFWHNKAGKTTVKGAAQTCRMESKQFAEDGSKVSIRNTRPQNPKLYKGPKRSRIKHGGRCGYHKKQEDVCTKVPLENI